jgi:hypothetical protein
MINLKLKSNLLQSSLWAICLSVGTFTSSLHAGQGGDGVRGNGQAIRDEKSGNLQLRDLVDPSVCHYRTPDQIFKNNVAYAPFFKKLNELNWYVAQEIENETNFLFYCFLPKLPEIKGAPENQSPLFQKLSRDPEYRAKFQNALQLGYREGRYVYFFEERFNEVTLPALVDSLGLPLLPNFSNSALFAYYSPTSGESEVQTQKRKRDLAQLLSVLHEVSHSYFPNDMKDRSKNLYGLVNTFLDVAIGMLNTPAQLNHLLEANQANLKFNLDRIDGFREAITFLFSGTVVNQDIYEVSAAQKTMLREKAQTGENQEDLYVISTEILRQIAPDLNSWDIALLRNRSEEDAKKIYADTLLSVLRSENFTGFNQILGKLPEDPFVAESLNRNIGWFSPSKRDALLRSPRFQAAIRIQFLNLGSLGVSWGSPNGNNPYHIVASRGLARLFFDDLPNDGTRNEVAVVDLKAVSTLPRRLLPIAEGLRQVLLASPGSVEEKERLEIARRNYLENDDFKNLFNLTEAKEALTKLPPATGVQIDDRARGTLVNRIERNLSVSLKDSLIQYLRTHGVSDRNIDLVTEALNASPKSSIYPKK